MHKIKKSKTSLAMPTFYLSFAVRPQEFKRLWKEYTSLNTTNLITGTEDSINHPSLLIKSYPTADNDEEISLQWLKID